ncbi:MAG: DUF1822 family protein [Xenococcaceae cyanobacterium MO_234.B1]|nr:DUF1822 family protein [Xenococcaceae cyanobacterium MO_234.B1]
MIPKPPKIENFAIPLPITGETRQIASQFAAQQPIREKAEQILLNTIAVSVVNNYLNMLGISTNLSNSDSWNPVMRLCNNVADLDIPGVGKLECRPIKSSASSCQIPMEVWDLRIGYVVVQIDDSLRKAAILGFSSQVTTKELALANLRPPEKLIDCLHEFKESIADNSLINLGQWLNNVFETGWQTVESLLTSQQLTPAFGFRRAELLEPNVSESEIANNRVSRAKLINLGLQFGKRNVVLLVEISPEEKGNIAVTLQVHPSSNDICLPKALELKVIESSDEVFMQAQARSRDKYIQLQFSGQSEEIFGVEIVLDGSKFSERFKL